MPNFPTSLPVFAAISSASGDKLDTVGKAHDSGHNNLGDEIEALAAKLGIGAYTPEWGGRLVGAAAGSAWTGPLVINPIVNGPMLLAQRGTSFAAVADGAYTLDRWVYRKSGSMVHTISQSTQAPSASNYLTPYTPQSLLLDCTTADASIAAGDFCTINQRILGRAWIPFYLRPFCFSFWIRSPKTGTHCVSFRNSAKDRSYVAEFTVLAANTWEFKIVVVTAVPSGGTWDFSMGIGLEVAFALAAGTTYQTTAGAWQNGNFLATANQVNLCDSAANDLYIADVQLDLGAYPGALVPVDPAIDYLRALQFYRKSFPYATAPAQNAGLNGSRRVTGWMTGTNWLSFPLDWSANPMVKSPTMVHYNPSAADAHARNITGAANCTGTAAEVHESGGHIYTATNAGAFPGHFFAVHYAADAEL